MSHLPLSSQKSLGVSKKSLMRDEGQKDKITRGEQDKRTKGKKDKSTKRQEDKRTIKSLLKRTIKSLLAPTGALVVAPLPLFHITSSLSSKSLYNLLTLLINLAHLCMYMFKCTVNCTFDRANPDYGNTRCQFFLRVHRTLFWSN